MKRHFSVRSLVYAGLLGAVFALIACSSSDRIPPERLYQQPMPDPTGTTILGSQIGHVLSADATVWVSTVDGKRIDDGRDRWSDRLRISAGEHAIGAFFLMGSFTGEATITLIARPGMSYRLRFDSELVQTSFPTKGSYPCKIWIEDAASAVPVSETVQIDVAAAEVKAPFYVPPILPKR